MTEGIFEGKGGAEGRTNGQSYACIAGGHEEEKPSIGSGLRVVVD